MIEMKCLISSQSLLMVYVLQCTPNHQNMILVLLFDPSVNQGIVDMIRILLNITHLHLLNNSTLFWNENTHDPFLLYLSWLMVGFTVLVLLLLYWSPQILTNFRLNGDSTNALRLIQSNGWYFMMLLEIYYSGALTMFFSTEITG